MCEMSITKAIVLAGGFGTRLQPLTFYTPKCLLTLGQKTAIEHTLAALKKSGIEHITIVGNKVFIDLLRGKLNGDKNITYLTEDSYHDENKLGAVGAIEFACETVPKDNYLIVAADNFSPDFEFGRLISEHEKGRASVTVALYNLHDKTKVSQFGVAVIDRENNIRKFQEKPSSDEALSSLISTGFYAVSSEFLTKTIPKYCKYKKKRGEKPDNLGEIFELMLELGDKVHGFVFDWFWTDIGKSWGFVSGNKYAVKQATMGAYHRVLVSDSACIHKDAFIEGPVIIEEGCRIEAGCVIGPYSHLKRGVIVDKNSVVRGATLFENVVIRENCKVLNCIIDAHAHIGHDVTIEDFSIVGRNTKIGNGSFISKNTRMH